MILFRHNKLKHRNASITIEATKHLYSLLPSVYTFCHSMFQNIYYIGEVLNVKY